MAVPDAPDGVPTLQQLQPWYTSTAIAQWNIDATLAGGDVEFKSVGPLSWPTGGHFPRALTIDRAGAAGTVKVDDRFGNTETRTLALGETLSVGISKVYQTGTSATGIVVLY